MMLVLYWALVVSQPLDELVCGRSRHFHNIPDMMYRVFAHTRSWRVPRPLLDRARDLTMPPITIIVTTKNDGLYLETTISTLLAQSYANTKVLLLDDASDDQSSLLALQRLEQCRWARAGKLRILRRRTAQGTYVLRNLGLMEADTDLVTFSDADDISHVDRIIAQYTRLQSAARQAIACVTEYVRITAPDCSIVSNRGRDYRRALQTLFFNRTRVIERVGYFDSVRISADSEFYERLLRVFGHESIISTDTVHYFAIMHNSSLSNSGASALTLSAANISEFLGQDRLAYTTAFQKWHTETPVDRLYMPFPLLRRRFACPIGHRTNSLLDRINCSVSIGIAATTKRSSLYLAVRSLAKQADRLYLYLNDFSEPPRWLAEFGDTVAVAHAPSGDLQDNGKVYFLDHMHGFVFTCDDDIVYPTDYVQRMILRLLDHDLFAVVGVHGVNMTASFWNSDRLGYYSPTARSVARFHDARSFETSADVLGTGTTAWHASVFPTLRLHDFFWPSMADIWLALYSHNRHVPLFCVARPAKWLVEIPAKKTIYLQMRNRNDNTTLQTAVIRSLREKLPSSERLL